MVVNGLRRLRPWRAVVRADRFEDARQHGRVDRPMAAEAVVVLGFDAPLRRPLEDAIHVGEAPVGARMRLHAY